MSDADADAVAKWIIAKTDVAAGMALRCASEGAWLKGPFAWTWFVEAAVRLNARVAT